jgi:pyridinium-3,5-biscarboxylic acid mononucleotide sulfurtransferase
MEAVRRSEPEIVARIQGGGSAVVALSGGVDSSLVAALAHEALGSAAEAVTLSGPAVSRVEVERARRVARSVGIAHVVLEVDPITLPEYRANPTNRCYFCRTIETTALRSFGDARGFQQYLDGVHSDDLLEDRPGLRAMDEAGFSHPLAWAGWTKADVRAAARTRHLSNWDEPSDACLASRVAHGDPISRELLGRVEAAESVLLGRGFRRVRVRVRDGGARIEVDPSEVTRLRSPPLSGEVLDAIHRIGFDPVTIDPQGYGGRRNPATVPP